MRIAATRACARSSRATSRPSTHRLARIEQIKRFAILPRDLSQADGELTPTLKIKRALVYRAYADRFARLYED